MCRILKEESLKKGICIGRAPLGYLRVVDERGEKDIIPDPETYSLVQEMFTQYATGSHSLQSITQLMKERGLKTSGGNPLVKSQVESMLKNPFYAGLMSTTQGAFPNRYEKLVSQEQFQEVQTILTGRKKKPFHFLSKPFILRGMITLRSLRLCIVSPEIKKGKYATTAVPMLKEAAPVLI